MGLWLPLGIWDPLDLMSSLCSSTLARDIVRFVGNDTQPTDLCLLTRHLSPNLCAKHHLMLLTCNRPINYRDFRSKNVRTHISVVDRRSTIQLLQRNWRTLVGPIPT